MPIENRAMLDRVAHTPLLLVACDFDGTIADIVDDPAAARLNVRCRAALAALGGLRQTSVAVVSGRPLEWLRGELSAVPGAALYGSHGAEGEGLSRGDAGAASTLGERLRALVPRWPGAHVEQKRFGAALHYRRAEGGAGIAGDVIDAARSVASGLAGVVVRLGSMVVELTASSAHKGQAINLARRRAGATAVVFFGDDLTDEDAFAALGPTDLGVKVGAGTTCAAARVACVHDVADSLEYLLNARRRWLSQCPVPALADHSVLSDLRTLAVIAPDAKVVWLCLPRADSPAVFAELVGGSDAGHLHLEPIEKSAPPTQSYLPGCMALLSAWNGGAGAGGVEVLDYLDCSGERGTQRPGRTDLIRVVTGTGRVRAVFSPRLDFGRYGSRLEISGNGRGVAVPESPDPLVLYAPGFSWRIDRGAQHDTAIGEIDLDTVGGTAVLELRFGTGDLSEARMPEPRRRAATLKMWETWSAGLRPCAVHPQLVERSALLLKALTYGPAGSILAAATTSLPEQIGGVRNWDYRFCWPRDAAMAATTLVRLGSVSEGMRLAEWLAGVVDSIGSPERLRPLYTVTGDALPPEAEIGELPGYSGSRPVRINNAACNQVQLDVFGPIAELLAALAESGVPISPEYWRLTRALVRAVEARWEEPDHGIWEIRGPKRHHVHSKLMCWRTVERSLVVHRAVTGLSEPSWERLARTIHRDVLHYGWNEEASAFTAAYGSSDVDATALQLGLCGLLDHSDTKWRRTVQAVEQSLMRGSSPGPMSVLRYNCDDGLPGREGGFVLCTCWLAESLLTVGRRDDAFRLLDNIASQAGRTGIFTEQVDGLSGETLGNLPQAYSHLGFINACMRAESTL